MVTSEQINSACRVFALVMRRTICPNFRFPGGNTARKGVKAIIEGLVQSSGSLGMERLVDFCVCQVYAASRFSASYRWQPAHSFGPKALKRFGAQTPVRRYYEDQWLRGFGTHRTELIQLGERRKHSLSPFIFPEYEELTKRRLLSSAAGYLICGMSTLLWAPKSPTCNCCTSAVECRKRTERIYPELYRLRCQAATAIPDE